MKNALVYHGGGFTKKSGTFGSGGGTAASRYWQDPVKSVFDNTLALPAGPAVGDRYIAKVTANGWTEDHIYQWNGGAWVDTAPLFGMTAWVDNQFAGLTFDNALPNHWDIPVGSPQLARGAQTTNRLPKYILSPFSIRQVSDSQVLDDGATVTTDRAFTTNAMNVAAGDAILKGQHADVVQVDADVDTLRIPGRITEQGIIDNLGVGYTGGTSGAPTIIDLSLTTKIGDVIRLNPIDNTNNWYRLDNPLNWQVVTVINEATAAVARIMLHKNSSATTQAIMVPNAPTQGYHAASRLIFDPNLSSLSGEWVPLSIPAPKNSIGLTDAANITVEAQLGDFFVVTLAGNRTLSNPLNPVRDGQKIVIRVRQDGTGGRTLAYDTKYRFSTDLPSPTLSIDPNKTDYLAFIYHLSDDKWDFVGKVFGF